MYLWNTATPNRDGDVDSDIVYHEGGHGLTWRMVGDMGGVTGGAVGEGMSDALATVLQQRRPRGRVPCTTTPLASGSIRTRTTRGPTVSSSAFSVRTSMAKSTQRPCGACVSSGWPRAGLKTSCCPTSFDGLNYTIPKPAYEDMRDGILESIANLDTAVDPAQARCTVWDAFAQFGVGVGASGQEICALGLCLFQAAESFVKPPECPTGPANMAPVPTILLPTPGTTVLVGTSVNFSGSATDDLDGDLTASMSWASSLQGAIGAGGAFSRTDLVVGTHVITASVTDSGALVGTATVSITVRAIAQHAAVGHDLIATKRDDSGPGRERHLYGNCYGYTRR